MGISQRVRNSLLIEARHRCTICAECAYEIHHIVAQAEGGSDDEENLIVLCPNCHQQRVHRNKEFTPAQLRQYKSALKEKTEVEKRLLLNLEAIRKQLPEVGAQESEAALRKELSEAASQIDSSASPNIHSEVKLTAKWLAERNTLPRGARRALEIECDLKTERELSKWKNLSIVAVDEQGLRKADDFPAAYSFVVNLNEAPYREWQQAFENEFQSSFYLMKRRTTIAGNRLTMIVGESDNLQNHLDYLKELVGSTNRAIADHLERRVKPDLAREKNRVLGEFDTIQSLRGVAGTLKL